MLTLRNIGKHFGSTKNKNKSYIDEIHLTVMTVQ